MFEQIFEDDVAPDQWKKGFGVPAANPGMVTVRRGSGEAYIEGKNANAPLRTYLPGEGAPTAPTDAQAPRTIFTPSATSLLNLNTQCYRQALALKRTSTSEPLDLNNMVGVEFSTFAGLYPTIGGKLIKAAPFASKQEAYDALETDAERAQLKVYDANIVIKPRNDDVMQVGASLGTLAQYYRARLLGTDSRRPGTD